MISQGNIRMVHMGRNMNICARHPNIEDSKQLLFWLLSIPSLLLKTVSSLCNPSIFIFFEEQILFPSIYGPLSNPLTLNHPEDVHLT